MKFTGESCQTRVGEARDMRSLKVLVSLTHISLAILNISIEIPEDSMTLSA